MKILYISSVPSKTQFDYMRKRLKKNVNSTKYGMQESGFKFHQLILKGIINDSKNHVYSLVGRPTSIKTHNNIIWKNVKEKKGNIFYEHIGFLNIPILKNLIISFSYFFKTSKWIKKNKNEDKYIILDAAYITVLPFINLATKLRKCKKIAIVCDLYEYMADVKDSRTNSDKRHKIIAKFMTRLYRKIDGFVLLTEQMNSVINPLNKPYIVMEGLVDSEMKTLDNQFNKKSKKDVIMYAGALRVQYGLKNLVEGFHSYSNKNAELWIYGAGDYVPEIKKISQKDSRIKYFGIVSNEEVVKKELEATLLINPRPTNQEFTKYSFPSKNMEYMVSGTPILTTKLPGMPEEYNEYVYLIKKNSPAGICEALKNTLALGKKELHKKGSNSKKFVMEKKNNVIQARKIINLCKEVIEHE